MRGGTLVTGSVLSDHVSPDGGHLPSARWSSGSVWILLAGCVPDGATPT